MSNEVPNKTKSAGQSSVVQKGEGGREGERFASCSKGRLLHAINYQLFVNKKYLHPLRCAENAKRDCKCLSSMYF